jgi:hypothetical protein
MNSMTSTTDNTSRRPLRLTHPAWCDERHQCGARFDDEHDDLVGDHVALTEAFRTRYGDPIEVGITSDAVDREHAMVVLAVPFDTQNMVAPGLTEEETNALTPAQARSLGELVRLEPEEARMLARFLMAAADEWERATR